MKHTASQDTLVPRLASTQGFEHDPNSAPHRIASTARAARGASTIRRILARVGYSTAIVAGACFFHAPANATLITGFSQESLTNTVVATDNGTATTISIAAGTLVTLGGGLFNVAGASFQLLATSIDAAINVSGEIIQHYSGSFCVSSVAGCGGNFLSGTFSDAAFGAAGGPGLTVQVSNPPESLTLTSNVIPASELLPPSSFNLTFVNLSTPLVIDGATIGAFDASFTGDVSANAVPEPASLALLGVGLLGLGMVRQRRV